jgi:hypothetical protein
LIRIQEDSLRFHVLTFSVLLFLIYLPTQAVSASAPAEVTNNQIKLNFPETATFSATLSSTLNITSVVLEYGDQQLTCGEVIAKAFPAFTPAATVNAVWTWDMRQSGSLPPGARIWWRWRYTDESGKVYVSEDRTAVWLDNIHDWHSLTNGNLSLHWYQGDQAFSQDLMQAAQGGLAFNATQSGLKADSLIDLYIYADAADMKDAILYEPAWTGGEAFPEFDIVILGISAADLDYWGRDAIIHELTHVLVGHLTFTCLGVVPTWLNEGLAVYSEGQLDAASQAQLNQAIQENSLLSVRSLSGGFSEVTSKANLSYSQSYSLVKFLIDTYGQAKMTALLVTLRDGNSIDDALIQVYGFDVDGLEDAWRKAVGAEARPISAQATLQPTATHVPTIVPVSGGRLAVTATAFAIPTSSFSTAVPTSSTPGSPPLNLTVLLIVFCCLLLLILGVLLIGIFVRSQKSKGGSDG